MDREEQRLRTTVTPTSTYTTTTIIIITVAPVATSFNPLEKLFRFAYDSVLLTKLWIAHSSFNSIHPYAYCTLGRVFIDAVQLRTIAMYLFISGWHSRAPLFKSSSLKMQNNRWFGKHCTDEGKMNIACDNEWIG